MIIASEITFYFDPEEYLKDGYQKAIIVETDNQVLNSLLSTGVNKAISRTDIEFYSFQWLDTSAINALNFGKNLISWNVESKNKNTIPRLDYNPIY